MFRMCSLFIHTLHIEAHLSIWLARFCDGPLLLLYLDVLQSPPGIEAEAVMLGQAVSMVLPKVVGYCITGTLSPLSTSTDLVLTITKVCSYSFTESKIT